MSLRPRGENRRMQASFRRLNRTIDLTSSGIPPPDYSPHNLGDSRLVLEPLTLCENNVATMMLAAFRMSREEAMKEDLEKHLKRVASDIKNQHQQQAAKALKAKVVHSNSTLISSSKAAAAAVAAGLVSSPKKKIYTARRTILDERLVSGKNCTSLASDLLPQCSLSIASDSCDTLDLTDHCESLSSSCSSILTNSEDVSDFSEPCTGIIKEETADIRNSCIKDVGGGLKLVSAVRTTMKDDGTFESTSFTPTITRLKPTVQENQVTNQLVTPSSSLGSEPTPIPKSSISEQAGFISVQSLLPTVPEMRLLPPRYEIFLPPLKHKPENSQKTVPCVGGCRSKKSCQQTARYHHHHHHNHHHSHYHQHQQNHHIHQQHKLSQQFHSKRSQNGHSYEQTMPKDPSSQEPEMELEMYGVCIDRLYGHPKHSILGPLVTFEDWKTKISPALDYMRNDLVRLKKDHLRIIDGLNLLTEQFDQVVETFKFMEKIEPRVRLLTPNYIWFQGLEIDENLNIAEMEKDSKFRIPGLILKLRRVFSVISTVRQRILIACRESLNDLVDLCYLHNYAPRIDMERICSDGLYKIAVQDPSWCDPITIILLIETLREMNFLEYVSKMERCHAEQEPEMEMSYVPLTEDPFVRRVIRVVHITEMLERVRITIVHALVSCANEISDFLKRLRDVLSEIEPLPPHMNCHNDLCKDNILTNVDTNKKSNKRRRKSYSE